MRSAFGRYLSPVVVERLAEHPERLELGGEMRNMTVMFADIRGFTRISERFKDDPQKLTTKTMREGGVATTGVIWGSWYGFSEHGWMIDPISPSLMVFVVFSAESALSYFRSEASRQEVRSAFGRYLSPVVVERLAEHPERLELGGEMRNMTVMLRISSSGGPGTASASTAG